MIELGSTKRSATIYVHWNIVVKAISELKLRVVVPRISALLLL